MATVFVLEEEPPSDGGRWYCRGSGVDDDCFESVDEAVKRGLRRARGVIVRTVGSVFYLAGERPVDWGHATELRRWPPTAAEREQMDVEYAAAVEQADADEAKWHVYVEARRAWLEEHHLGATVEPVHECAVRVPGMNDAVVFDEFDFDGRVCGACGRDGRMAFGSAVEVLSSVTRLDVGDVWVQAVVDALDRERSWVGVGRRGTLVLRAGDGEMFHVSAAGNRTSIEQHGLDWRRMGPHCGVAGAESPELDAVFLCESLAQTTFFIRMSRTSCDLWAVNVTGRWVENGPSGWVIVSEPIGTQAVRLVERDVPSPRRW